MMAKTPRKPMKNLESASASVHLTERERSVLPLIVEGLPSREIAERLDVGYETVKMYVKRLQKKLNARTRTEIAVLAIKLKLVDI